MFKIAVRRYLIGCLAILAERSLLIGCVGWQLRVPGGAWKGIIAYGYTVVHANKDMKDHTDDLQLPHNVSFSSSPLPLSKWFLAELQAVSCDARFFFITWEQWSGPGQVSLLIALL